MAETNSFKELELAGWRQFQSVDIEFHEHLTVITGTNGAGKSTLLNLLTPHLGVSRPILSNPFRRQGQTLYSSGLFNFPKMFDWIRGARQPQAMQVVGRLTYANGVKSVIEIPANTGIQYSPSIRGAQSVRGFHFPSHRLLPNYRAIPNIPFAGMNPEHAFGNLIGESNQSYLGVNTNSSIMFQLKNIIAAWAAIGEGNRTLEADPAQYAAFEGLNKILRMVIPKEIGFRNLIVRPPDILLETETGTFLLDAASGGLTTLIEIAALVYTCRLSADVKGGRFTVTFDEPENHLHPSMQRSLMPSLIVAFPEVQFIVVTHSPFIVSSMRDSNVYALHYATAQSDNSESDQFFAATRQIVSTKLDYQNRAGTAGEILREVLGVPVTLPVWVENSLDEIVEHYQARQLDENTLAQFRLDVQRAGLEELFPEAISRLGGQR